MFDEEPDGDPHGECAAEIARLQRQCEVLRHERDHERACRDSAVTLLAGIHALMYPAPIAMPDGRMMVFRPNEPDPHALLQELSDRIRALPDEMRARGLVTPNASLQPAARSADRLQGDVGQEGET